MPREKLISRFTICLLCEARSIYAADAYGITPILKADVVLLKLRAISIDAKLTPMADIGRASTKYRPRRAQHRAGQSRRLGTIIRRRD